MKRLFSLSIQAQLLLITLIVAIPAAGVLIYSGIELREEAVQDARKETQKLAGSIAAEQQGLITAAQQLIIALAQLPDVRNRNTARVQPVLRDILSLNAQYSNIFVADLNGLVWATAVPVKPPFIISDRRYFRNALASRQLSSGEFIISRATGRPSFNLAYPQKNDRGETSGAICVGFIPDSFNPVLERSKLPPGTNYTLLDHNGFIMSMAIDPAKYLGKQLDPEFLMQMQKGADTGTFIGLDIDGIERIITYRKLRLPGEQSPYMYIRTGIPVAVVLSGANKTLLYNLTLYTSFLVFAFFIASLIGKRSIADRVTLLEKASRDLAGGNLHVRISDLVVGGELGNLGRTFDHMANQLAVREQALIESERNYREIFNATKEAIFVCDAESGDIVEMNKTVEHMFGYSREELLHQPVQKISASETPYSFREVRQWMQKASGEGHQSLEWECRRKNGERFWAEVVLSATRIGGAGRVLAVLRDITDRRHAEDEKQKLQSQLLQSQKMESIGRLAGGVAHDFNNMLCVILGYIDLIRKRGQADDSLLRDLQEIEKAALHSRDVTAQLLAFSRKQIIVPVPVDLNHIISNAEKTLGPLIGEDIELQFYPGNGLWNIKFDPSQLQQVLVNLAVNARDALPSGGTLTIKTANVFLDEAFCREQSGLTPGDYVLLEVSDNGHGMDPETLAHIFEPFFTTKSVGEGTGLGLATVYGIIEQNGGCITVASAPGAGTLFKVYIPKHGEQEKQLVQTGRDQAAFGAGTILLVEDDVMVCRIAVEMLKSIGYNVLVAHNPLDALSLFEKNGNPIDLLITDVVMPKMNGKELRDRIKAMRPEIKVLFMSGYTSDVIAHHGILEEEVHFLQKPFSLDDIAAKIREVLKTSH
jgi:two-component system cell cycle sensor histidine kinase/response regulator CckA